MERCSKEKEIERLSKAVWGNGKKGLIELTSNLYERMENIDPIVKDIQANVQVLLQFQTQITTENEQEEKREKEIKEKEKEDKIQKRWFIGLAVTTMLGMLSMIIALITMIDNNSDKSSKADNEVTEQEFKNLWYEYRKDHLERNGNIVIDNDTISYLTYKDTNN